MTTTRRRAAGVVLGVTLLTAACSETGSLEISNESPDLVTVQLGDEKIVVSAGGGAIVHDVGCAPGDVLVVSASGQTATLDGPVCAGMVIAIAIDSAGQTTVSAAEGGG